MKKGDVGLSLDEARDRACTVVGVAGGMARGGSRWCSLRLSWRGVLDWEEEREEGEEGSDLSSCRLPFVTTSAPIFRVSNCLPRCAHGPLSVSVSLVASLSLGSLGCLPSRLVPESTSPHTADGSASVFSPTTTTTCGGAASHTTTLDPPASLGREESPTSRHLVSLASAVREVVSWCCNVAPASDDDCVPWTLLPTSLSPSTEEEGEEGVVVSEELDRLRVLVPTEERGRGKAVRFLVDNCITSETTSLIRTATRYDMS